MTDEQPEGFETRGEMRADSPNPAYILSESSDSDEFDHIEEAAALLFRNGYTVQRRSGISDIDAAIALLVRNGYTVTPPSD